MTDHTDPPWRTPPGSGSGGSPTPGGRRAPWAPSDASTPSTQGGEPAPSTLPNAPVPWSRGSAPSPSAGGGGAAWSPGRTGSRVGGNGGSGVRPGDIGTRRGGSAWREGVNGSRRRRSSMLQAPRHHHPHRRLALRLGLLVVALLSALSIAGIVTAYGLYQSYRSQLPSATQLSAMEPSSDSRVYDRRGNQIAVLTTDQRHTHIALPQVSRWARLATIDVEDRHFYEEGSWDMGRIVKAGYEDLRKQSNAQGASTITQQLAKIAFLSYGSRSLEYKAKQVILGIEIENNFSKDQILEMYLNRIEYGNHSVGIEAAAETYFHKSAHDLDLAESALLAGLPQSPVAYFPLDHDPSVDINPLAKQRQETVLAAMVSNGHITQAQADAAAAEPLNLHSYRDSTPVRTAFTDYVEKWLRENFGGSYLQPGGWRIDTTLDPQTQQLAEQSLTKGVSAISVANNGHNGSLVSIDPKSGEVVAMVGNATPGDPQKGSINLALTKMQPGSTIKLFTYTGAILSRQYTMNTPISDAPVTYTFGPGSQPYSPQNYDTGTHIPCVLRTCLGNSFNIPAVRTEVSLGVPYVTDLEIAMGLTSLAAPDNRPSAINYAATLGGLYHGVTPLELADGVATLADLGLHHPPTPVLRITDVSSRNEVYHHDPAKEAVQVVPDAVAFIISEITSNDSNRATEFGAHGLLTLPDRRISAKTGTTPDYLSNWTVGWTPDVVSVVMVGNPDLSCLRSADANKVPRAYVDQRDGYLTPADVAHFRLQPVSDQCGPLDGIRSGITGAAPIWNSFMKAATAAFPKTDWYAKPPDVLQSGTGDDAYFFLPGTTAATSEGSCWYYGPEPEPGNPCTYVGSSPPQGFTPRQPVATAPPPAAPTFFPYPTFGPPGRARPTPEP